jgi:Fic family protein
MRRRHSPPVAGLPADPASLARIVALQGSPAASGHYLHWDELRHREPPAGYTVAEWWTAVHLARRAMRRRLPMADAGGVPFVISASDELHRLLHEIDRDAGPIVNSENRDRFIVSSIIEEAITSSQLEGASTTRLVAKEMLRQGRPPRDRGERMIFNNYQAMELIRHRRAEALSPGFIFSLHEVITRDTLDTPDGAGRFRRAGEDIVVVDEADGEVLHVPPPADTLPQRLDALCRFANGEDIGFFLHPVLRAVLAHFWLAYDHPFVDGNGRTARALFYWSMLNQGYWLAEFISISRILKTAHAQYSRAFLYTETDENDTTYFALQQLRVQRRAMDDLAAEVRARAAQIAAARAELRLAGRFNVRQLALLAHALEHPDTIYTIEAHRRSHDVVYQTARTDLLELAEEGYLVQQKAGRKFVFVAAPRIRKRRRRR